DVRVGLLLPLSGPAAELGQDMLRAAQMALFDAGPNTVVLLPRDTRGSAEGATLAAQELLDEGVELLIGPLFSRAVNAVTPIAQAADVRVLAFSNVTSVADQGTYLLGFRPEEQVERVVQHALDQGIEIFAGLAPDDAYGDTAMRALQRAVIEQGGIMGEVHFYPPTLDDPSSVVREIADYAERRAALDAERAILEAMGEGDEVAQAVLKQIKSQDTFGEPPFDAIMIADGGDRLRSVASLLTFYDVDPETVQFLGTIRWQDDARVLSEEALAGGWFAASSPDAFAAFENRFNSVFEKTPEQLASLAYDATALAVIVQRDIGDRRFDPISLTDPEGFAGATGLFRLKKDGLAQHGLAVLEVADNGVREIDPTPTRFEDEFVEDPFFGEGFGAPGLPFGRDGNVNSEPPLTQ
ncbi:MAG: penicillin-binding protein activator, partial [Alphaproteobacteria bacterium]|nr:penicillin-binding protein activator [Alphaproteobacteria bacterium]